ncbi:MAG: hypothetical protein C0404_11650 [Verrucomicrobia bacterium]|nr:hypothetical protein [Verrucomicrobiota bacterium]
MLTGMTVTALFLLDGAAFCILLAGYDPGAFGMLALMLLIHNLIAAVLMRVLVRFFPIGEGLFAVSEVFVVPGSRDQDRWQARAFLGFLSCNYFDRAVPIFMKAQWYWFFGAKVAWSARIAGRILDCTQVEVGRGSTVGEEALVMAHYVVHGRLCVGRVRIKDDAVVGSRAVILPGVTMEEGATVGASSLVTAGKLVPAGEVWAGVPAKKIRSSHHSRQMSSLDESLKREIVEADGVAACVGATEGELASL